MIFDSLDQNFKNQKKILQNFIQINLHLKKVKIEARLR